MSDIHWEHDTIEFVQYKIKFFTHLPLHENIEYALIDYLKNGRPESELRPMPNRQNKRIDSNF
jgi:hypothetical protein